MSQIRVVYRVVHLQDLLAIVDLQHLLNGQDRSRQLKRREFYLTTENLSSTHSMHVII